MNRDSCLKAIELLMNEENLVLNPEHSCGFFINDKIELNVFFQEPKLILSSPLYTLPEDEKQSERDLETLLMANFDQLLHNPQLHLLRLKNSTLLLECHLFLEQLQFSSLKAHVDDFLESIEDWHDFLIEHRMIEAPISTVEAAPLLYR